MAEIPLPSRFLKQRFLMSQDISIVPQGRFVCMFVREIPAEENLLLKVSDSLGIPHNRKLLQESCKLCRLFNRNQAKPAEV